MSSDTIQPNLILTSITNQFEAVFDSSYAWLNAKGANYEHYDALSKILKEARMALARLESLRKQIEKGIPLSELRQEFVELANECARLNVQLDKTFPGSDLKIFGSYLETLATVSATWALPGGSPSLMLAAVIALGGPGLLGDDCSSATDLLFEGMFESGDFGVLSEIEEMEGVYSSLEEMT